MPEVATPRRCRAAQAEEGHAADAGWRGRGRDHRTARERDGLPVARPAGGAPERRADRGCPPRPPPPPPRGPRAWQAARAALPAADPHTPPLDPRPTPPSP